MMITFLTQLILFIAAAGVWTLSPTFSVGIVAGAVGFPIINKMLSFVNYFWRGRR